MVLAVLHGLSKSRMGCAGLEGTAKEGWEAATRDQDLGSFLFLQRLVNKVICIICRINVIKVIKVIKVIDIYVNLSKLT